ncbi:proline--tRNA ligase [archaeon]|nr:proline--tRNA ligase [archaeon]|tara:strand:+ start:1591 stop:3063 length:1473 start_codon:yes stop_codon:yes gene_type:complete
MAQDSKKQDKKANLGLTVTKEENFSEWFTQLIQKSELMDYSPVSGCYILRPRSYFIWETIKEYFDKKIKADGVENCYFPMFIPESLLTKEEEHVEGFAPEVAWVETGGSTKLKERLAIRPTSETIMYDAYSKWIRSHNDLPLRLNQWCNIVRWEFKHCTPFIRLREFLWQEGHTVFATREEAVDEARKIVDFYIDTFKEVLAVPLLTGQKSDKEKFAGADFTYSIEGFMPDGKALQAGTSHYLGQNFAKAFDIKFKDKNEQVTYVHQNSWGISIRSIGAMIMLHSDDKGLVLPPRVAKNQIVIVPLLFKHAKEEVLAAATKLQAELKEMSLRVHLDAREQYSPGYKYNEWELKGTPIRLELGPRDLENKHVMLSRRDDGEKRAVSMADLNTILPLELEQMHERLYNKAKDHLDNSIVKCTSREEIVKAVAEKKIALIPWCGSNDSEIQFKDETGIQSLNAPFNQPDLEAETKCVLTGEKAVRWHRFGKSY